MNNCRLTAHSLRRRESRWWLTLGLCIVVVMGPIAAPCLASNDNAQLDFATAAQAVDALMAAERSNDESELIRVLGPAGDRLIHSGDPVADRESHRRLVDAFDKAHRIEPEGPGTATLIVGPENWPLPIPIVEQGGHWRFDTPAGEQKIIDRRVGRNELNVIEVCHAYVAAQREYASKERLGDGVHEFAAKIASSPGKHDGLYWKVAAGEGQSPFGPLVASARAEGYTGTHAHGSPYHGYYYRILTRQGPHAAGGAKNYIVAGHMTRGFALLAFPATWGDSGVMTFMVNQHGIVFQKNLGPDTASLASKIEEFDPDLSWKTAR
jgi:Protein of unknown function (DUF2950)